MEAAEIIRQDNYKIIHLTDGKSILEAVKLINSKKADGINFNFVRNFPPNINEIRSLVDLKFISINDYSWDFDYSAINHLHSLTSLSIYTTDKKEINYSNYPALKSAAIFWRPKAKSLFQCTILEHLFIGKYNEPDLHNFGNLINLKYLRLNTGSVKTLNGIEQLQKLETLKLTQVTKLTDLDGIESLLNLKNLFIDNCRNIKHIDKLKEISSKVKINIVGTTPQPTAEKFNSR